MKTLDKRILGRMSEDERRQYEQDLPTQLPDLLEFSEFVDTHLLAAQLPSWKEKESVGEEPGTYVQAEQE